MGNTCKSQNCCNSEAQKELQAQEVQSAYQSIDNLTSQKNNTNSNRQYDHSQIGTGKIDSQLQEQKQLIEPNIAKEQNQEMIKHIREASMTGLVQKSDEDQRVEQLKNLVGKAQNLKLKVVSSTILKKGQVFIINPLQLEGTVRKNQDGYIYSGCKKYSKPKEQNSQNEVINDLIIPSKETNEKHRGRHFVIWYDIPQKCYKVKDLGIGFGVFVRLTFPLALQDNHLINLGESFVVVNLVRDSMDVRSSIDQEISTLPKLRLKLFGGPSTGEIFYFTGKEERIVLGRLASCEVQIDDSLLSKQQASITQKENQWVLTDGINGKPSTNGTWLYLNEDMEITHNLILKTSQTLLQAQLVDPNESLINAGNQESTSNR